MINILAIYYNAQVCIKSCWNDQATGGGDLTSLSM